MPEHLSEQDIQRYHSRGLSPAERLGLSDHIAQCDACSRRTRAADPRPPFDVAAFRAEFRVPAEETRAGKTRPALTDWRDRLLTPRVLAPAFGAALLLVVALLVQNVSLRREYAALARHANPASGQAQRAAIALQEGRPRPGGQAATPGHSSGQPVRIAPEDLSENILSKVMLSPDERRLLASADDSGIRGGEDVNSDEHPKTVETIRPTGHLIVAPVGELRWKAVEGAAFYKIYLSEVYLTDAGLVGNKALDWFKEAQIVTGITLPLHHALAPGKVYQWDVTAYAGKEANKPLARVSRKFLVIDKKRAEEAEQQGRGSIRSRSASGTNPPIGTRR